MSVPARRSPLKRATRSPLLSGAALATAGALALTPLGPVAAAQHTPNLPASSTAGYRLTAYNPFDAWQTVADDTRGNLGGLANQLGDAPFRLVQTIGANQLDNLADLPQLLAIASRTWTNLRAGVTTLVNDPDNLGVAENNNHRVVYNLMTEFDGGVALNVSDLALAVLPITTTATSGLLLGAIGPVVGPILAAANGAQDAFTALADAEFGAALGNLADIPAHMTGALLNGGQHIDAKPLLDLLGIEPALPTVSINKADLELGGLLSPGTSLFKALSMNVTLGNLPFPVVDVTGEPAGPLASLAALPDRIAEAIRPPAASAMALRAGPENDGAAARGATLRTAAAANPLKELRLAVADTGKSTQELPGKAQRSIGKQNDRIAAAGQKDGVAGAVKQVGAEAKYRVERLGKDIRNGLAKVGVTKKNSPTTPATARHDAE